MQGPKRFSTGGTFNPQNQTPSQQPTDEANSGSSGRKRKVVFNDHTGFKVGRTPVNVPGCVTSVSEDEGTVLSIYQDGGLYNISRLVPEGLKKLMMISDSCYPVLKPLSKGRWLVVTSSMFCVIGPEGSHIKDVAFPNIKKSTPYKIMKLMDAQVGPEGTYIVTLGNDHGDTQILSISKESNAVETVNNCYLEDTNCFIELNGKKIKVDNPDLFRNISSCCSKDGKIIMAGPHCLIVVDPIKSTVELNEIRFSFSRVCMGSTRDNSVLCGITNTGSFCVNSNEKWIEVPYPTGPFNDMGVNGTPGSIVDMVVSNNNKFVAILFAEERRPLSVRANRALIMYSIDGILKGNQVGYPQKNTSEVTSIAFSSDGDWLNTVITKEKNRSTIIRLQPVMSK